jgi:outer membrane protein assembly factor BamB
VPTPVYQDGFIVITNAHGPGRPIYAIRTDAEGDITKTKTAIAWSHDRAGNYMQTPLLHNGIAYFCFDNGVLSAYDLKSGERLYQQRLGAGTSGHSSSPVAAADRLYITNEDGKTYVIAAGREYKLLAENELGETVMATPAVADGVLYVRGRRHLFAIAQPK